MRIEYKEKNSLEKRLRDSQELLKKYPDRVPIVLEKRKNRSWNPFHHETNGLIELKNNKFLAPKDLTVGQFFHIVRKNLNLRPDEALYFFINNKMPLLTASLGSIYREEHDQDQFLYVLYSQEETFG
ncbi:unnamed protein product [Brachionus calyciflorus]|uniref:Autophagy-related protein n=1 Tax=Brachionus calyciflorus TaxID=104777 RepID=A0A813Y3M2_9BILA|nr:unnamed protein product [Brachionus calyciflorus]